MRRGAFDFHFRYSWRWRDESRRCHLILGAGQLMGMPLGVSRWRTPLMHDSRPARPHAPKLTYSAAAAGAAPGHATRRAELSRRRAARFHTAAEDAATH